MSLRNKFPSTQSKLMFIEKFKETKVVSERHLRRYSAPAYYNSDKYDRDEKSNDVKKGLYAKNIRNN